MARIKVDNFGTAERTQQAYEQVIKKLNRLDYMLTVISLTMAFFVGIAVTDMILTLIQKI